MSEVRSVQYFKKIGKKSSMKFQKLISLAFKWYYKTESWPYENEGSSRFARLMAFV